MQGNNMKEALERIHDLTSRKHSITMRMVNDICNHALEESKFCLSVEIPEIKDGHCSYDCPLNRVTKEGMMQCMKAFGVRLPDGYMQPGIGCPRFAGESEAK
jgi:hypothetical protein